MMVNNDSSIVITRIASYSKFIKAITMCSSHYLTPINEPFRPIRNCVVKPPKVGDCQNKITMLSSSNPDQILKVVCLHETNFVGRN